MSVLLLIYAAITYFSDHTRVIKLIVSDTVYELYFRTISYPGNLQLWLGLQFSFSKSFNNLGDYTAIPALFDQVRLELRGVKMISEEQKKRCSFMVNELEVNLVREFRLAGVNERHVLITADMFNSALNEIIELNGGY